MTTELDIIEHTVQSRLYLPYFVTNPEKIVAELEDALILIHEEEAIHASAPAACAGAVRKAGEPLLIIAEDVEGKSWPRSLSTTARP